MVTTYRVDYSDDDGNVIVPLVTWDRRKALDAARRASKTFLTAYVIVSRDGADIGQLVYHSGYSGGSEGVTK